MAPYIYFVKIFCALTCIKVKDAVYTKIKNCRSHIKLLEKTIAIKKKAEAVIDGNIIYINIPDTN